jgi:hypothetical protein
MGRSTLGKAGFAAAVVLALGFGAREAVSKPAPPTSAIACETDEECQSYCEFKYPGQNVRGICVGHCVCLF